MPHIDWWKREAAEQRARAEKAERESKGWYNHYVDALDKLKEAEARVAELETAHDRHHICERCGDEVDDGLCMSCGQEPMRCRCKAREREAE